MNKLHLILLPLALGLAACGPKPSDCLPQHLPCNEMKPFELPQPTANHWLRFSKTQLAPWYVY